MPDQFEGPRKQVSYQAGTTEEEPASPTGQRRRTTSPPPRKKTVVQRKKKTRKNRAKSSENPVAALWGRVTDALSGLTPLRRNILIGCAALLLVAILLLVLFIPSCGAAKNPSSSLTTSMGEESVSVIQETGYDKTQNQLDTTQFTGTILEKTEDAGIEYAEETLFLGDSNTVRMISYADITGASLQNAIGVVGMGIHSFTSYKCVQFEGYNSMVTMPEAVGIIQPKRVVITFGTNNVAGMGTDSFISHYKNALDAVKQAYEYADIIIASVPPVDQYHINEAITMTNIDKYNIALAELADEEGVKFLNWSEALKDPNSGFAKSEYTVSDGIHISREGMEALFTYLRTHAYITEDRRPQPLNKIPKRIAAEVSLVTNDGDTTTRSRVSTTSSSNVSTSVAQTATVRFSAGTGGSLSAGGSTYTTYTVEVALGGTAPSVRAVASAGYTFSHWECSVGSLDAENSTLSFNLHSSVAAGDTVTVTAVFKEAASSSSRAPSSTSQQPQNPDPGPQDPGPQDPDPTPGPDPSSSSEAPSSSSEAPPPPSSSSEPEPPSSSSEPEPPSSSSEPEPPPDTSEPDPEPPPPDGGEGSLPENTEDDG